MQLPVAITVEGANILTRSLIVFGQGAIRCHPYVLKEIEAARATDATTASIAFDAALFGHVTSISSAKSIGRWVSGLPASAAAQLQPLAERVVNRSRRAA
jgi:acyl-CoA dehydrogenase